MGLNNKTLAWLLLRWKSIIPYAALDAIYSDYIIKGKNRFLPNDYRTVLDFGAFGQLQIIKNRIIKMYQTHKFDLSPHSEYDFSIDDFCQLFIQHEDILIDKIKKEIFHDHGKQRD